MDLYFCIELALRFPVYGNRTFDHRFIPLPPEHARISIDQFEDRIEERIENGWDGKSIPGISNEKLQRINQKPTETQP
jgi:hypothetical protein